MAEEIDILFVTSGQQREHCPDFEGRRVKTPLLDELAHAGTRFSACITPNVVCQPSHASILTGLQPRTHGVAGPVSTLDLPATFYDWAGAAPPGPIHSRSLRPPVAGDGVIQRGLADMIRGRPDDARDPAPEAVGRA